MTFSRTITLIPLLMSMLVCLSACQQFLKPRPFGIDYGLENRAPPGTPNFQDGWRDGCESGIAAYGTMMYKTTSSYTFDQTRLNDPEYYHGWELAFRHCRWYTSNWESKTWH